MERTRNYAIFINAVIFMNTYLQKKIYLILCAFLYCQSSHAFEYKTFSGILFVKINAGCFLMGKDTDLKESSPVEQPQHKVCISHPYYLSETEITQNQWESIMGSNPSKSKSLYKPVERVSWNDAQEFIQRLNAKEGGRSFRLPSEAEWEYAARAGSKDLYSFGSKSKDLSDYGWYGDEGYGGASHQVALKKPNSWGLYDMHGNVWEWVQDWYGSDYYAMSPENDPRGPDSGQYKSYRGGSWVGKAVNLRSSLRYSGLPSMRTSDIGIRLLHEMD
ncbi:MAG: formylglycine-generating enzyme family protein [Methylococcales bacterium]|nr:MAG: formylglycine-generating enzyme family protein [Methylococcales bacterium]